MMLPVLRGRTPLKRKRQDGSGLRRVLQRKIFIFQLPMAQLAPLEIQVHTLGALALFGRK